MKAKRTFFCLMMTALVAAASVSCVGDEKPIFDKNATVRMQEALQNAQTVLMGATYGWIMEDFMDEENTTAIKGGYTILVKFDKDKVTAWGEMCQPSESYTSLYKMTTDDGPVLSFDDNNYVLHYFCTPSGTSYNGYHQTGAYKALGGDFEFLILEAKPEQVKLKGKRGGEIINLYPLDKTPEEYMANLQANYDDMLVSHYEAPEKSLSADVDRDNRHISINYFVPASGGNDAVEVPVLDLPFLYTESGIKTTKTIKAAAEKVENPEIPAGFLDMLKGIDTNVLTWNGGARTLIASDVTLQGILPVGWLAYKDYIGEYTLTYNTSNTLNVKIEADEPLKSYILSGLNDNYTLKMTYDLASGTIGLRGQIIYSDPAGVFAYWFAPWALGTSQSFWYSTNYGMNTSLDTASYEADPAHFILNWVAGPSAAGKPIDSFILYKRFASGTGNTGIPDTSWHFPNTNYRMQYLSTMKKK
ncbi:MAG: DUF4302 domain-containing protein [Bacteroidales bacterium]|nr:DUF4302 domain-containing protein [Bacteroidales bacterium]